MDNFPLLHEVCHRLEVACLAVPPRQGFVLAARGFSFRHVIEDGADRWLFDVPRSALGGIPEKILADELAVVLEWARLELVVHDDDTWQQNCLPWIPGSESGADITPWRSLT